ncbi:MAG: tetratricopeptide repeat protein [Terriglobia bacterium]
MKVRALALAAAWLCAAVHLFGQASAPPGPGTSRVTPSEPLLVQAQLLVRDGKLDEALPVIHRFLEQRPDSPDGRAVLGFILFKQSKPAEALREYGEAAKYRRPSAFESKIIGLSEAMLNDYASADPWLARSLELNPKDLEACNDLGQIKFLRETYSEAVGVFRECLKLDAKNVFAENGMGSAYERMSRLDEAAAAYRNAIAWQSAKTIQDPTPFCNLGRVLLKQNKPKEALTYLTRAVELGPDLAEALVRRYLQTSPDSGDGHALLGFIQFSQQRWKESMAEYVEASQYRDLTASELKTVALDCAELHLAGDADNWLTRSLEMNPEDAKGWEALGQIKGDEQRFEEAIKAFQRSLALTPRVVTAESGIGLSCELLSRLEDAKTAYKTAIGWEAPKPQDPTPFHGLGRVLLKQNRPAEALPYLRQAVELGPEVAEAHEELGKAYSSLNQLAAAQKEIEKAVELAPKVARLHFMLGQSYRKAGLMEKAKAELDLYAALVGTSATPYVDPK